MDASHRIRKWREDAGLTQAQLCSLLGISQTMLSGFENGRHRITLDLARAIAAHCDATAEEWAALRLEAPARS